MVDGSEESHSCYPLHGVAAVDQVSDPGASGIRGEDEVRQCMCPLVAGSPPDGASGLAQLL